MGTECNSALSGFEPDYLKKEPKPKSKKLYFQKRQQLYINTEKGKAFEKIFTELNGGIKPNKGFGKPPRFIDNLKDGIAKELKSGFIKNSKSFKDQVIKDITILRNKTGGVKKIEWHFVNGVDENALKFIYDEAKKSNVLEYINIIIY